MFNEFIIRIGTFFVLIGAGIFILFVASEYAGKANFDYLFWAVLSVSIGLIFRSRRPPKPRSDRFSYIRRLRESKHPKREK